MFTNIFNLILDFVGQLAERTTNIIDTIFSDYGEIGTRLGEIDFNLLLFSETPIISTNLYDILLLFFTIFYSMFFIVLLYKATKKFINVVFGVFKV